MDLGVVIECLKICYFLVFLVTFILYPVKGYFLMKNPKNIAITGGSSGIGAALARHYAASGVTLHLHGRNPERLEHVAAVCREKGAAVHLYSGDVTDREATARWITDADKQTPLDLVIANAGISAGTGKQGESDAQACAIFDTNITGVVNTVHPILPMMVSRKRGQIGLMSSLAGIRGLPSAPAYSASKAWVRVYGEGLRGWLRPHGIEISVICPGYVKTPMTDANDFPMPMIIPADRAAAIIADGLEKNKARIAFPRLLYWPLWLVSCLPAAWTDDFFGRLPGKPSFSEQPPHGI